MFVKHKYEHRLYEFVKQFQFYLIFEKPLVIISSANKKTINYSDLSLQNWFKFWFLLR